MRLFAPEGEERPAGRRWRALLASVAVHGVLLALIAVSIRRPGSFPVELTRLITLTPPSSAGAR
ncbi:MAG TPA: hypothetical protein VLC11_05345, partial [Gemmatimonadales bacterium]|nr:hypothetical protein [Gemmatimonadales bacterium]